MLDDKILALVQDEPAPDPILEKVGARLATPEPEADPIVDKALSLLKEPEKPGPKLNAGKTVLSTLDRMKQEGFEFGASARVLEHAQGIGHLVKSAARFMAGFPSEGGKTPAETEADIVKLAKALGGAVTADPGAAARALPEMLLGPELGAAIKGDFDPLKEDPGGALVDALLMGPQLGMPAVGMTAGVLSKARRVSPLAERVLSKADPLMAKVIPKYMWSNEALAIEARRAGEHLAASSLTTEPAVRAALELYKQDPRYVDFLEPALEFGKRDVARFRKAMTAQEIAPGQYTPFSFKGKNLELSVDANGVIEYGRAGQFAALPPDVQTRIFDIRKIIDTNHAELVRRGILDPKTGQQHMWSYLHKMYQAHFDPTWGKQVMNPANPLYQSASAWITKNMPGADVDTTLRVILKKAEELRAHPDQLFRLGGFRNPAGVLIPRKELPPAIEAFLGPLHGEKNAARLGATLDAQFRLMANDTALERMLSATALDGRPLLISPLKSGGAPAAGFVKLSSDDVAYGRWAGHWVHPDVADIIPSLSPVHTNRFLNQYLQAWKSGKTVWNPNTHLNNMMGNVIFATLAGISPLNPANMKYYKQAATEILGANKGFAWDPTVLSTMPQLQAAVSLGGVRPSFAAHELKSLANRVPQLRPAQGWVDVMLSALTDTKLAERVKTFYDAEDQIMRYAAFLKMTERGMSGRLAAVEVNKYFPSYAVSSPLGRFLRGETAGGVGGVIGNPFVSFPLETARIYSIAAREKPFQLFAALSLPFAATNIGLGNAGLTLEDYHRLRQEMPSGQQGRLLIPWGTSAGDTQWVDATSIIPGARSFQGSEVLKSITGRALPQGPMGELWGSGPAWSLLSLMLNKRLDTGHELYSPERGEGVYDAAKLLFREALPSPPPLTQLAERFPRAIAGVPPRRFASEPESLGQAAFFTLFPGLSPRTSEELTRGGMAERKREIGEVRGGLRSIMRNPSLAPGAKERRLDNIIDELIRRNKR